MSSDDEDNHIGIAIIQGIVTWVPTFLIFANETWVKVIGICWAYMGWLGYNYYRLLHKEQMKKGKKK